MREVISNVEAPRRFNTGLISAFAAAALLLAITGIYAVVAFSVSLRTREIAIRMALGSQRTGIARLVLISGAKLAAGGPETNLRLGFEIPGKIEKTRRVPQVPVCGTWVLPLLFPETIFLRLVLFRQTSIGGRPGLIATKGWAPLGFLLPLCIASNSQSRFLPILVTLSRKTKSCSCPTPFPRARAVSTSRSSSR